jgi:hypothetical protein
MAPSEDVAMGEKTLYWTAAGAAAGGVTGMLSAGWEIRSAAEGASLNYVGKTAMSHAASLAAVAGVFAATDSLLTQTRGHSALNPMIAGCAAGSLMGFKSGSVFKASLGCGIFGAIQGFGAQGHPLPARSMRIAPD